MRKLSHQEIVDRQKIRIRQPRLPLHVIVHDVRSLYNVGAIFRTADGAGVQKIWLCGITGHPPNAQISKTALGAEESVAWEYREDVLGLVRELKARKFQTILLEQTEGSISYHHFRPQTPVCIIIGNEISGVREELLALCDSAIEIEMSGIKNSLNVSVAFGVIAYHLRYCILTSASSMGLRRL